MKKGDVEIVAKLLTEFKDSLDELETALKKNNSDAIVAAKRKLRDLQMQIGRKI